MKTVFLRLVKQVSTTLGRIIALVVFFVTFITPYTFLLFWMIYLFIIWFTFAFSVHTPHYATWKVLSKKNDEGKVSRRTLKYIYVVEMTAIAIISIICGKEIWQMMEDILALQPHGFFKELADKMELTWPTGSSLRIGTLGVIWWYVLKIQLLSIIVGQYLGFVVIPYDVALRKDKSKQIWGKRFN